jgi:hypothetical protein
MHLQQQQYGNEPIGAHEPHLSNKYMTACVVNGPLRLLS